MKTTAKNVIREESGKILILVLVLLVVGGLLLGPLLGLMSTGLVAGQVYEKKAAELYAADAGVEDAIWKITNSKTEFDSDDYYAYPDRDNGVAEVWAVNEKSVDVEIYRSEIGRKGPCHIEYAYQILSRAEGADGGLTAIEAYLSVLRLHFSALLEYAIISNGSVTIGGLGTGSTSYVYGDVFMPDPSGLTLRGEIQGEVVSDPPMTWPTIGQLSAYYRYDLADGSTVYYTGKKVTINIPANTSREDPYVIGPLYAAGELTIQGDGWIRLGGTIYVKDGLKVNPTSRMHIDMAEQTIFVEGGSLSLNPGITLYGSGCIIARDDIDFQPTIPTDEEGYILVMSVEGTVTMNPTNHFHGTVAGKSHVQVQPNNELRYTGSADMLLNFPLPGIDDIDRLPMTELRIVSWQIQKGGQ